MYTFRLSSLLKGQNSFEFHQHLQKIKIGKFCIQPKIRQKLTSTRFTIQNHHLDKFFSSIFLSYCQWKSGYYSLIDEGGKINKIRFEVLEDHYDHFCTSRIFILFYPKPKIISLHDTDQNRQKDAPEYVTTFPTDNTWRPVPHVRASHYEAKDNSLFTFLAQFSTLYAWKPVYYGLSIYSMRGGGLRGEGYQRNSFWGPGKTLDIPFISLIFYVILSMKAKLLWYINHSKWERGNGHKKIRFRVLEVN